MRNFLAIVLVSSAAGSAAMAQEGLTYSFDGRVGLGYLHEDTAEPTADGFRYFGPVARLELSGRAEFLAMGDLRLGALGRFSYQRGTQSNYDLTVGGSVTGPSSAEFGGSEMDLAVYAGLSNVTLSYGDMETAFDLATREIEQGGSLLDGGNAVWMNIGDASGSTGTRNYPTGGPAVGPDVRTVRLDVQLSEFTLSASRSKVEVSTTSEYEVDALGAVWRHEFENTTLFVGAGYDQGPSDRFRSFSFGLTSGGFNLVMNRIHRDPKVFNSGITRAYDTTFNGLSLSYDFGDLTLGAAQSSQSVLPGGDTVFVGSAKALFGSWQARENLAVDFEYSESRYTTGGDNTKKASLAVALDF